MHVITESTARTTRTANGVMTSLATPTQGSAELSSWRVQMEPDGQGPVHTIDREQVWMPLTGSFAVTMAGDTQAVGPGEAVILPAGVERQIRVVQGPAEALVCMPAGGQATRPGSDERLRLPWAE
jgi:quercetin dioxygenase-like cupin family protein